MRQSRSRSYPCPDVASLLVGQYGEIAIPDPTDTTIRTIRQAEQFALTTAAFSHHSVAWSGSGKLTSSSHADAISSGCAKVRSDQSKALDVHISAIPRRPAAQCRVDFETGVLQSVIPSAKHMDPKEVLRFCRQMLLLLPLLFMMYGVPRCRDFLPFLNSCSGKGRGNGGGGAGITGSTGTAAAVVTLPR